MIGDTFGPYTIVAKLGEGGMGEVYRARDTTLNRDVAVKVLPELFANDPERLARFRREALVLTALNHPHIAQVYGFDDSTGVGALVMELVDGPTLADLELRDAVGRLAQQLERHVAAHRQTDQRKARRRIRKDALRDAAHAVVPRVVGHDHGTEARGAGSGRYIAAACTASRAPTALQAFPASTRASARLSISLLPRLQHYAAPCLPCCRGACGGAELLARLSIARGLLLVFTISEEDAAHTAFCERRARCAAAVTTQPDCPKLKPSL